MSNEGARDGDGRKNPGVDTPKTPAGDGEGRYPRRPRNAGEAADILIGIAHLRGDLARIERRIVDLLEPFGDVEGQELARLLVKADELRNETNDLWDTLIEPFVAKYRAKPGMPPWPP